MYKNIKRIALILTSMMLVQNVNAETAATLESKVDSLQKQLNHLRAQIPWAKKPSTATTSNDQHDPIEGPDTLPLTGLDYIPIDLDVPGQSFVSSGPYIGIPLEFSGRGLIINTPSVNQDVALLKIRKNIRDRLKALGINRIPDHSHILLSGAVEGQGFIRKTPSAYKSDIDLSQATLDAYILGPSHWVSSLISFSYDNSEGTQNGALLNNYRTQNSRIYLNQAFITLGDFQEMPLYGTLGQYYVPFGTFSSNMISSPLTKTLARTKARAILIGYQPQKTNTPYASAYIFRGDTNFSNLRQINNGGINVGYRLNNKLWSGDVGAGVIANIADSGGMQNNGFSYPYFGGFGSSGRAGSGLGNETLIHRVPAYDLRGSLAIGQVNILAEYITASTAFSPVDLTMNNKGAKPRALNMEIAYTFKNLARPLSVAAGYGMSKEALALGLAAQRYAFVVNTSIWRNTLQSIEFRRDVDYAASRFANGALSSNPSPIIATGKAANMITAQFDVYF